MIENDNFTDSIKIPVDRYNLWNSLWFLEWQMKSEGYEGKTEMVNQAHFNSQKSLTPKERFSM